MEVIEKMKQKETEKGRARRATADSVVVAGPAQTSVDLDNQVVILGISSGKYYRLDDVGARVWSLLREPRKVSWIVESLLTEYDVERSRLEADLLDLLNDLAAEGLVEVHREDLR